MRSHGESGKLAPDPPTLIARGYSMLNATQYGRFATAERGNDSPRLLAAAPIISVSEELDRHVEDLHRLAPASDATTALTLYRDKLARAIQRARRVDLFVSAEEASMLLGKSVSMITYLCRTGALRAKKVGGTWQIDRLEMERMHTTSIEEKKGSIPNSQQSQVGSPASS